MKLWQIKSNALRLMFADSDIQFSEEEFKNGSLMSNGNTREKLILMTESIRRGIDTFYGIVGTETTRSEFKLKETEGVVENEIDLSTSDDIEYPTRVDIKTYSGDTLRSIVTHIDFVYDATTKSISFSNVDYTDIADSTVFRVWYRRARVNIPYTADELEFNLDMLLLPPDVQRMLPYYVKGELYEEDEPATAELSMQRFMNFLYRRRRPFSVVQKKVQGSNVFKQTN